MAKERRIPGGDNGVYPASRLVANKSLANQAGNTGDAGILMGITVLIGFLAITDFKLIVVRRSMAMGLAQFMKKAM